MADEGPVEECASAVKELVYEAFYDDLPFGEPECAGSAQEPG